MLHGRHIAIRTRTVTTATLVTSNDSDKDSLDNNKYHNSNYSVTSARQSDVHVHESHVD